MGISVGKKKNRYQFLVTPIIRPVIMENFGIKRRWKSMGVQRYPRANLAMARFRDLSR
jgi:hypothetical protein